MFRLLIVLNLVGITHIHASEIPTVLPTVLDISQPYKITTQGRSRPTTIEPYLQRHLQQYIKNHFSPVAGVAVVEVATGRILALAQGKTPEDWGGKDHTALHSLFPAASLFKTVATTAALEILDMDPNQNFGLQGGCGEVRQNGVWLKSPKPKKHFQMTLKRAYGMSCNGFYAQIAVNKLGVGSIMHYANLYRWNGNIPADFTVPISPLKPPDPKTSSALTVGKFSAGFGYVGTNSVHAAWIMQAIARNGKPQPLRLFTDQEPKRKWGRDADPIISTDTAQRLRKIMEATVRNGTAHFAFKRGRFWKIRRIAGGKTGTLTGDRPKGMTTWFAGMMPLDKPEIAVAAVVILEDLWHIKGANLAAEAFYGYRRMKQKKKSLFSR